MQAAAAAGAQRKRRRAVAAEAAAATAAAGAAATADAVEAEVIELLDDDDGTDEDEECAAEAAAARWALLLHVCVCMALWAACAVSAGLLDCTTGCGNPALRYTAGGMAMARAQDALHPCPRLLWVCDGCRSRQRLVRRDGKRAGVADEPPHAAAAASPGPRGQVRVGQVAQASPVAAALAAAARAAARRGPTSTAHAAQDMGAAAGAAGGAAQAGAAPKVQVNPPCIEQREVRLHLPACLYWVKGGKGGVDRWVSFATCTTTSAVAQSDSTCACGDLYRGACE